MAASSALASSLAAVRELSAQRGYLDLQLRGGGVERLAAELEELYRAARAGSARARVASVGVASWLARLCLARAPALGALREAATTLELELARSLLLASPPRSALARGGHLAEVCIPARTPMRLPHCHYWPPWPSRDSAGLTEEQRQRDLARLDALIPMSPSSLRPGPASWRLARMTQHPDPILIGRLLDARWLRRSDALVVASRRPSSAAIAWTIASRDRWFGDPAVRDALAANPFSPTELVLSLLPSVPARTRRALADNGSEDVRRAARLFGSHPSTEEAA